MAHNIPRSIRRTVIAVCLCALLSSCASQSTTTSETHATPGVPINDLIKQADERYAAREDTAKVREGQTLLREARAAAPDNYDAAWRMARISYVLGDNDSLGKDEREAAFREGQTAGEAAAAIMPSKPEGHFWLGANLGGYAQLKGPLSGIAAAKRLRQEMEMVLKIDDTYQGGSAYMALGQLDTELPSMLGGDSERAVTTLEKGLRVGDQNSLLHLALARAYLATNRKDDARKQLNFILQMKPSPDYLLEYKEVNAQARQLLATRFSK